MNLDRGYYGKAGLSYGTRRALMDKTNLEKAGDFEKYFVIYIIIPRSKY
jgi:hypothetical protein